MGSGRTALILGGLPVVLATAGAFFVLASSSGVDGPRPPSAPSHPSTRVVAVPAPEERAALAAPADRQPVATRLDQAWVASTAASTAVPPRALAAYASAELVLAAEVPSCRIGWPTLAAIGAVESGHGAAGGGLQATGVPVTPIVGVRLDGGPDVADIRDSDDGRLDGDREHDRAVGPMQFIPTTWQQWGTDADGDGLADPQDLDDAATAAARYLCAVSGDLVSDDGWRGAVLGYNRSSDYAAQVSRRARDYVRASRG